MRKTRKLGAVLAAYTISQWIPVPAFAADHLDSPAATADPTADITDLYAWMSEDTSKLNLVLDVHHNAGKDSAFGTAVQYAIHINSAQSFGAEQTETLLLCQFYSADALECWMDDTYVEGNPNDTRGISSDNGGMRVFAGLRNDPFFMEFVGFSETVRTVVSAAPSLTFDPAGCPQVDVDTSAALVSQLQSGMDGEPASDTFAGANVLSIAIELDTDLVTSGGPILGVWASTHAGK